MDVKAAYYQAELQIAAGIRRLERAEKYLLKEDAQGCLWEALMHAREALDYVRRVQNG